MDPVQAATGLFSPAMLAAYGPWGTVAVVFGFMLYFWLRGREDRMAKLDEAYAASLREDQRELFQRQKSDIEGLKVDKETLETRLRATERLCEFHRNKLFDMYQLCRDNSHSARNAHMLLIAKGVKTKEELPEIVLPVMPQATTDLS